MDILFLQRMAAAIVAILCLGTASLSAQEDQSGDGPRASMNEEVLTIPADPARPTTLEATFLKPPGPGPFPLAIVNHGSDKSVRPSLAPRYYKTFAAYYYLSRGYAVILPMMRGFAESGGNVEHDGCDLARLGLNNGRDIQAVIDYMRRRPEIDASRIVVSGQSFGGWNTLAYGAIADPHVKGLIEFAGGVRASDCDRQDQSMANAMETFGRRTKIPSIWFHGDNDKIFSPATWRANYARYQAAGGKAELVAYGNFGEDAHNFLGSRDALRIWTPKVDAFLARIGMPHETIHPEFLPGAPPQPTNYAGIEDFAAVPYLGEKNAAFYSRFLAQPLPRALVISPHGVFFRQGGFDPIEGATRACQEKEADCQLYAYDNDVVWTGPDRPIAVNGAPIFPKTTKPGASVVIGESAALNPDCSLRAASNITVTQQPAHGVVETTSTDDYPHFPPNNPLSACNHTKAPMTVIRYTPSTGFVGADFLTFKVEAEKSENGKGKLYKIAVAVK
jgi:dienelactone hydrolase